MGMALRKPRVQFVEFEPVDLQQVVRARPGRVVMVEMGKGRRFSPAIDEAVATLAAQHPQHLAGGRIDVDRFPKLVSDFVKDQGLTVEAFEANLPLVGLIREGALWMTIDVDPLIARGRASVRTVLQQLQNFTSKFVIHYTPKPKEEGEGAKAGGAPKAEPNRDKPTNIVVCAGGKTHKVQVYEGENLLESCLERGVELDYSCKEGMCDSCMVKVLKGAENLTPVTNNEKNVLGDLVEKGARLSCQALVKGPVEIQQDAR